MVLKRLNYLVIKHSNITKNKKYIINKTINIKKIYMHLMSNPTFILSQPKLMIASLNKIDELMPEVNKYNINKLKVIFEQYKKFIKNIQKELVA